MNLPFSRWTRPARLCRDRPGWPVMRSGNPPSARVYAGLAERPPSDAERTRAADGVLEQLEGDGIAHDQLVERRAVAHVAAVKVDLAIVQHADEAVPLPDEELHDPADRRDAAPL